MTALLRVVSFGYRHLAAGELPPEAEITLDVRRSLWDPHSNPAMKQLTGHDPEIREQVLATKGARGLAWDTAAAADQLRVQTERAVTVAVGCQGGRHRSVVLASRIADLLREWKWEVDLEHLHVHLPVIERPMGEQS